MSMQKLWACHAPDLAHYLEERARLENTSAEDMQAFFGLMASEEPESILAISGGVAEIQIEGILTKSGPDFLDRIFGNGGTSYLAIIDALAEAEESPDVNEISLIMDTPGGDVNGVDDVYQAVASTTKPVTAVNTGMLASAGYWIASAADQIVASSAVVETGSIGVVVTAFDQSERLAKAGVRVVKIASENAPGKIIDVATDEGIEEIRNRINAKERVFVSRVATGRGISEDTIRSDFGRGSVLIAKDPNGSDDAMSVGMIDEILYTPAKSKRQSGENRTTSAVVAVENSKGDTMDEKAIQSLVAELEQLKADHADLKVRVERAMPYLLGTEYPAAIRTLAVQVLDGKAETAELKGAIVALDALREETIAAAAVIDTDATPEVVTQAIDAPTVSEDGMIRNELDYKATVERMNANRGIARQS